MLTLWQTTHLNSEYFFLRKLRRWKSLNLTEVTEVTPLANAASVKINVGAWYKPRDKMQSPGVMKKSKLYLDILLFTALKWSHLRKMLVSDKKSVKIALFW